VLDNNMNSGIWCCDISYTWLWRIGWWRCCRFIGGTPWAIRHCYKSTVFGYKWWFATNSTIKADSSKVGTT